MAKKGCIPWNKNLTKETDERVKKNGENVSKAMTGRKWKPKTSESALLRIERIKNAAKKYGRMGGYRERSGRGKQGRYKGYWCQSSWELAYVIYNLEHAIKFERNKEGFEYIFEGKKHLYFPDYIENSFYVEIKGYLTKQMQVKIASFNKPLRVLREEDIRSILNYVTQKYGNDFIRLYEP